MAETITIQVELNPMDFSSIEGFLKKYKAKIKILDKSQDSTEFSRKEYAKKLDRALAGETIKMSRSEMRKVLLAD